MVRVRSTTRLPAGGRLAAVCVAVMLGAASGCTMCPDPFDYSGPVPNGTPPQNDFRARSGGILPLGGVPRPWPQVVHAGEAASAIGTDAGADAEVETVSVLQTAGTATGNDESLDAASVGAAVTETHPSDPHLIPVAEPVGEESPPLVASTPEHPLPACAPPPVPAEPLPVGETPGWRPRR